MTTKSLKKVIESSSESEGVDSSFEELEVIEFPKRSGRTNQLLELYKTDFSEKRLEKISDRLPSEFLSK